MEFITIKTEADKMKYIIRFAEKQKHKHYYNINCLKAERNTPSDYTEEIKEESEKMGLYIYLLAVADDIEAVKKHCKNTIKKLDRDIQYYTESGDGVYYLPDIHDYKLLKFRFEEFLKIAEAETNTEIFIERIDF